jgi:Protein of unknown function (DUF2635)
MFVKPAPGRAAVRDPVTLQHVPEEGREVPEVSYWVRRVRGGDLVVVSPPPNVVPLNQTSDSQENS